LRFIAPPVAQVDALASHAPPVAQVDALASHALPVAQVDELALVVYPPWAITIAKSRPDPA
jgi:hypothetical protein